MALNLFSKCKFCLFNDIGFQLTKVFAPRIHVLNEVSQ